MKKVLRKIRGAAKVYLISYVLCWVFFGIGQWFDSVWKFVEKKGLSNWNIWGCIGEFIRTTLRGYKRQISALSYGTFFENAFEEEEAE